jgi:hypothetical protein
MTKTGRAAQARLTVVAGFLLSAASSSLSCPRSDEPERSTANERATVEAKERATLDEKVTGVWCLAFSPDGKTLA